MGGIPHTPSFCRVKPCRGHQQAPLELCSLGLSKNPFFFRGKTLGVTNNPNPFLSLRRGFRPLPKPLANLWQGDVIDSGQGPPFVKVLVSLAKPLPLRGER